MNQLRIDQIRESERKSHTKLYSTARLYQNGSWLRKPIKTVEEIIPLFHSHKQLHILDLGCGVGRNCLFIPIQYPEISCSIDCVDILDIAIKKLMENADKYGVTSNIHGIISSLDRYEIPTEAYNLVLAISALEHICSEEAFAEKLYEINNGICKDGIACFVINSSIREFHKITGNEEPAQFEVNMETAALQNMLHHCFVGWRVLKETVHPQQYEIPRENHNNILKTNVVTFVVQKH